MRNFTPKAANILENQRNPRDLVLHWCRSRWTGDKCYLYRVYCGIAVEWPVLLAGIVSTGLADRKHVGASLI